MTGENTGARRSKMLVSCDLKFAILLGILLFFPVFEVSADKKGWRGIVPLQSTRSDVERLLGKPWMDRGGAVVYDSEDARVSIEYSKGPCAIPLSVWNVPQHTVISIWVTPKTKMVAGSELNTSKYKRVRDEHRPKVIHYIDEENGIEYNIDEDDGIVGLIKYFPAAANRRLLCSKR